MVKLQRFLLFCGVIFLAASCSSNSSPSHDTHLSPDAGKDVGSPPEPDQKPPVADQGDDAFTLEPSAKGVLNPGSGTIPPGDPIFPSTDSGDRLSVYLKAALTVGDDALAKYTSALDQLKAGDQDEMLELLIDAYNKLAAQDYFARYLLISTVGQLPIYKAVIWLDDLAQKPLPQNPPLPIFSQEDPAGEELVLRLAAIKGIGRMISFAQDATAVMEAEQTMVDLINGSSLQAIQIAAIEAYLAPAFPSDRTFTPLKLEKNPVFIQRRGVLSQMIDPKHHHLLTISSSADLLGVPSLDGPAEPHVETGPPPTVPSN